MQNRRLNQSVYLSLMIALDVVLSPLFRIEGMAPMSSVLNVLASVLLGPFYATSMAFVCALIRMTFMGIPPLALTGAVFGAFCSGIGYKMSKSIFGAMGGEVIGTGLIGSLLSFPVMVWFTGHSSQLYWFIYTPRFIGAACIGSSIAYLIWRKVHLLSFFTRVQTLFGETK